MLCAEVRECPIALANEIKDKGFVAKTESQSDTPSPTRLVIRVKIPVETRSPAPDRQWSRGALLLVLGIVVAAVLTWVGISMFRAEPTSSTAPPAASAAAPTVIAELPKPPPEAEPEVQKQPAAPPSPINQAVPDVPRGARETIRGTIRVSVRVTLDQEGRVVATDAVESGPSRYFERLAVEAAGKWTFTPADSDSPRTMLVRFYFKRTGTTARASQI